MGLPAKKSGVATRETADPVDRAIPGGRRDETGKRCSPSPRQADADHVAGHEYGGGLEHRATADLGPELAVGRDETSIAVMWNVSPTNSPMSSQRLPSRSVRALTSKVIARTRFRTSTHHAMRLRGAQRSGHHGQANAHAKLVSGKLNR